MDIVGVSGNVCIFATSYEVKAKVLKGKIRLGIQPPILNTFSFTRKLKPRDVLSQVRSCFMSRSSRIRELSMAKL